MKEYFDNMFIDVDSNIKLDDDQIKIATTDDKYMMVIAGAGSGKTTTISAKVNYLIDKQRVSDDEILVISFTNKAVSELKEQININFKHNVSIMTFHKFGYEIIKANTSVKSRIIKDNSIIVKEYIESVLINDKDKLKQFLDFFIYYFDIDEEFLLFSNYDKYYRYKNKEKYPTLKSRIEFINENLNSLKNCVIANFLYMNNIKYECSKPYIYDPSYKPDFTMYYNGKIYYIEFFNMNKVNRFKFYYDVKLIERIHKRHHTNLIKIYDDNIVDTLVLEFKKRGIITNIKNINEIFDSLIIRNKDASYKRFVSFCTTFLSLFKSKGYGIYDFERLSDGSKRNRIFLDFMKNLYIYYQNYLNLSNQIDFDDMINKANEIVCSCEKVNLKYKYIIIDEYQDISDCRFNLIKNISKKINCHIMVVGDDWQCIYSFASSNINLFTNFYNLVGGCTILKIVKTYRNSQQLIDIAGKFILKNNCQIEKNLISSKSLDNPVCIVVYKDIEKSLVMAIEYLKSKYYGKSILILGRYTFDKNKVLGNIFSFENGKIVYGCDSFDYMTIHASKGLGYDNVILLNALDDTLGFPSKIKNDPLLDVLINGDESIKYAEERRLLYVALTRTKNEVIILTPFYNQSIFIKEIKKYKGVKKCSKLRIIK